MKKTLITWQLRVRCVMLCAVIYFSCIFVQAQTTVTFKPGPTQGKCALLTTTYGCAGNYQPGEIGNDAKFEEIRSITWSSIASWGCPKVTMYTLLKFDELSTIPTDVVITSAELKLFGVPNSPFGRGNSSYSGSSFSANTSFIQRVTQAWDESTVTWNTQPSVTIANQITIPQSTLEWNWNYTDNSANLLAMIQDMVAHPDRDFGFLMKLGTEQYYRSMVFASNCHSDPALWPELKITYYENLLPDIKFNDDIIVNCLPDSVSFLLDFKNQGTADLAMPYYITMYKDSYHGEVIYTHVVNDDLKGNTGTQVSIKLPINHFQGFEPISNLVFALNDKGNGVAQHGGQQEESDTTNNTYSIQYESIGYVDTLFVTASICEGERYTQYGFNESIAGDYVRNLKTQYGCDSVIVLHLTVNPIPNVEIVSTGNICEQGFIELEIVSDGDSFLWNNGNTETKITVSQPGTYSAIAFIGKCKRTAYYDINAEGCPCTLYVPNVFTPNNDGYNDAFKVELFCPNLHRFEIVIYNRWGMKVYQNFNSNFAWSGHATNGTLCPMGVYMYIIIYSTVNNPDLPMKRNGIVTIIH